MDVADITDTLTAARRLAAARRRRGGRADGIGTEGYRDEVYAAFQAIWHLKDWIRNDLDKTAVSNP